MSFELPDANIVAAADINRADWLKLRGSYIGGSDAATVAGENPYSSRLRLWAEKTGQLESEDIGDKPAVQWGNRMEPFLLQDYAAQTGHVLHTPAGMYAAKAHPFMAASLDGVIVVDDAPEIVEIKTAGWHQLDRWVDGPPDNYLLQVTHYMAVTGAKRAHVHVMFGNPASDELWDLLVDKPAETVMSILRSLGYRTETHVIERDDELIASLIKLESDFQDLVEKRVEPDADGSEDTAAAIQELHPGETGKTVDVDESFLDLLRRREVLKDAEKAAKAAVTTVENEIKQLMAEADTAQFNGKSVCTWNISKPEARTVEYAASEYRTLRPASIAKLTKTGVLSD